jgi:transcription elongation factor GreA
MVDVTTHYLSEESLTELKTELETLRNTTIPEIAKRIDEAKQQGDLSENAEYHQAREDMAWAQGRVIEVEQIINNSQIIVKQDTGVVAVGSTIQVELNGKSKNYTIVGPQEINPTQGLISNESPLGEAFLGHHVGDRVEVTTPAGKNVYTIKEIK